MPSKPPKAKKATKTKQVAKTKARSQAAQAKASRNAPSTDSPPITVKLPGRRPTASPSTLSSNDEDTTTDSRIGSDVLSVTIPPQPMLEPPHAGLRSALEDGWVDVLAPGASPDAVVAAPLDLGQRPDDADSPPFTPRTLALMDLVTDDMLSAAKPGDVAPAATVAETNATRESPAGTAQVHDPDGEAGDAPSSQPTVDADDTTEDDTSACATSPSPPPRERPAPASTARKRAPPSPPSSGSVPTRGRATRAKKTRVRRSPSCGVLPTGRVSHPSRNTSVEAVASERDDPPSPLAIVPRRRFTRRTSAPPVSRLVAAHDLVTPITQLDDEVPASSAASPGPCVSSGGFAPGSLAAELLAGQNPATPSAATTMPGATPAPATGFPEVVGNGPHWLYENQDIAQVNEWSAFPGGKVLFAVYSRGALDYIVDPTLFHLYALVEQVVARFLGVPRVVRSPPIPKTAPSDVNQAPYGSLLHGMTTEHAATLLRQRCLSTPEITLLFFPFGLQPCNVFLSLGQISFRSDEEVRTMALKTMRDRHFSTFTTLVQSSPSLRKLGDPSHVAEGVLRSVSISNTPQLGKGSVPTPVFNLSLGLPPVSLTEWLLWSQALRSLAWGDGSFGTVCVRDIVHCAGCHSCEHFHWACPFRDIPNWHGSIPRSAIHWPAMEPSRAAVRGRRRGLAMRV